MNKNVPTSENEKGAHSRRPGKKKRIVKQKKTSMSERCETERNNKFINKHFWRNWIYIRLLQGNTHQHNIYMLTYKSEWSPVCWWQNHLLSALSTLTHTSPIRFDRHFILNPLILLTSLQHLFSIPISFFLLNCSCSPCSTYSIAYEHCCVIHKRIFKSFILSHMYF